MKDRDHAHGLFRMALKDFKAIQGMKNDSESFSDEIFGFHVQQTVEKSLKAWLAFLGVEYPLKHDLSMLLTLLEKQNIDVETYWDFVEFNAFAVEFRYGESGISSAPLDRSHVLKQVQLLLEAVQKAIAF
jgi:HEPN domain-containing protein